MVGGRRFGCGLTEIKTRGNDAAQARISESAQASNIRHSDSSIEVFVIGTWYPMKGLIIYISLVCARLESQYPGEPGTSALERASEREELGLGNTADS